MRGLAWVCVALLLFGCSKPAGPHENYASATAEAQLVKPPASDAADPNQAPAAAINRPMLAYAYQFAVEAPGSRIRGLVEKHEAACSGAGFAVCQVTSTNIQAVGKDQVTATLTIKATAGWLARFRKTLADDVSAAGGRLSKTAVTSEDLAVQIVDTDARLKAQTALRDRLQDALQHRPGKVSDLVDVSTALAKAQGDLDSMQSQLALLRQRVALSEVTIEYSAAQGLIGEGTWSPLSGAVNGFMEIIATAMAAIIYIVAFVTPWAIVIGLAAWVFFWFRRRRRAGRKQP